MRRQSVRKALQLKSHALFLPKKQGKFERPLGRPPAPRPRGRSGQGGRAHGALCSSDAGWLGKSACPSRSHTYARRHPSGTPRTWSGVSGSGAQPWEICLRF